MPVNCFSKLGARTAERRELICWFLYLLSSCGLLAFVWILGIRFGEVEYMLVCCLFCWCGKRVFWLPDIEYTEKKARKMKSSLELPMELKKRDIDFTLLENKVDR